MGTIHHHAIVVTSCDKVVIEEAHKKASDILPYVSDLSKPSTNGYQSFSVFPDGSKEYWSESDEGNEARAEFIRWLDSRAYDDGSNSIRYAHVSFGELGSTIETN